jgi:hypothetical protein
MEHLLYFIKMEYKLLHQISMEIHQ